MIADDSSSSANSLRFSFEDTPSLTAALKSGDEEAFRWIYQQWNQRLFYFCFVLAQGNEVKAKEILQNTYLRIHRHIKPLPHETALWNWVARAARTASIDAHRAMSRYRSVLDKLALWTSHKDQQNVTPSEENFREQALAQRLDQAIESLSDLEQSMIHARYFKGESLATIAKASNLSVRAVEGRLARIRKRLRTILHDNDPPKEFPLA